MRAFKKEFPKGYYKGQRNEGFPISDVTTENLDYIKKKIWKKNGDACFCFDGRVGDG